MRSGAAGGAEDDDAEDDDAGDASAARPPSPPMTKSIMSSFSTITISWPAPSIARAVARDSSSATAEMISSGSALSMT